jgi:Lon protease-like protein
MPAPPPVHDFPLFPLGLVALPTESVPLHIFEDRYLRMIAHCLEGEGSEFGIIWLSDEELKQTGCACAVEQVLERTPDGRMNILARGTRPFTLLERQDDLPYPAGVVEFAADEEEEPDEDSGASARELYAELVEQATDRELTPDDLAELDSYHMAGTVEFELPAKQQLLELRSENARLRLLATLLSEAIERLELLERAQVRAQSNGKVRFG